MLDMSKQQTMTATLLLGLLLIGAGCATVERPTEAPEPTPTMAERPMEEVGVVPTPDSAETVAEPPSSMEPSSDGRRLGSVRFRDATCPSGDAATCKDGLVQCPYVSDAAARLRITGPGTAGTVVITTGELGTGFFSRMDPNGPGNALVNGALRNYAAAGLRVVEVAWEKPGVWGISGSEISTIGSITVGCRFATLLDGIHDDLHTNGIFAAQGNSGGGAQIATALLYYGAERYLDVAVISGGPPPCSLAPNGDLNRTAQDPCVGGDQAPDQASEPLLSRMPDVDYSDTIVHLLIGDTEPSAALRATAEAYAKALGQGIVIVPNTEHQVPLSRDGIAAITTRIIDAASATTRK
jgi:hypothetical protein